MKTTRMFLLIAFCGISLIVNGQKVSTESLLREMTDLQGLSLYPIPAFKTIQYSSYDRRSQYPDQPGWFMNSDGFGGEPVPGFESVLKAPDGNNIGEYLICDVKGPGAIVRLWTAWIEGEIELYIDSKERPIYNGNAQKFFQHTYEALLDQELEDDWKETFAQNTAGYYPIPFAKSLKIVWIGDISKLHFYHVQLRIYEEGSKVVSFNLQDLKSNAKLIAQVTKVLSSPSEQLDEGLQDAPYFTVHLNPGEKRVLTRYNKMGAITRLAAFVTARDRDLALRQTLLDMRFDGAPWGQVQSPIGDFFGAAPGINPYESLPFSVFEDGRMICRYFMPFRDSAFVYLENKGDQEVTVTMKALYENKVWEPGRSMHFRARWRTDHDLLADPASVYDIPYLLYRGKGRMVGAVAFVMNPTNVPSSYGNWWGEGDEKIFIDDDPGAAFIGTGSEDYFNYAWSSSAIFTLPYCGQPRNDGPANRGFVTNYRWHILDNIAFEKAFDFYMELYPHRVVKNFSYSRMVYLYTMQNGHDDHLPISKSDVRELRMPENWWPDPEGWAANALFYQIEDLLTGEPKTSLEKSYMWSAENLCVWYPKKEGDEIELRIPVAEKGKYMIAITAAKTPMSGKIEVSLNGNVLKLNGLEEHDLSDPYRTISRNLKSESLELIGGIQIMKIKSVGSSAGPVGLDFIWVKRN